MRKRAAGVAALILVAGAGAFLALRHRAHRVHTESHTVMEAVRRVVKLSTVEMTVSDWRLRRDSKDLFGVLPVRCEKTVAVFFRGKVAAGFDLGTQRAEVVTDAVARRVRVRLPAARLLYTDVPAPELLVTDGSLCNRVEASDYTRLHAEARKAVEDEALARGILGRAETQARDIIGEVVRPLGYTLELEIAAPDLLGAPRSSL